MNEAILEKLRKILTLAGDKAAAPGEIEAAMAKAKAIAIAHSIELASIDLNGGQDAKSGIKVVRDDSLKQEAIYWYRQHNWISWTVKQVFGIHVIVFPCGRNRNRVCIVGEETDVLMAKEIFVWLEKLYPQSFKEEVKRGNIPVANAANEHGYFRGLSHGIVEANKRAEAVVASGIDGSKWAMVVRNKEQAVTDCLAKQFPSLREAKSKSRAMSAAATNIGYQKGKSINLNQMGGHPGTVGQIN